MKKLLVALGALTACGTPSATASPPDKVFVCKYVDKPGEGERLQTGQNPISVSVNAIPIEDPQVGDEFADAQGRSVVIAFDTGQPEPSPEDCPPPNPPPPPPATTTTAVTTSTSIPGTSTSTTTQPSTSLPTTTSSSTTSSTPSSSSTTTTTLPPGTTTTTVPGVTTTTTPGATTTTTTPGLTVDFLTPICDGDVPYLTYAARFGSATVVQRITFVNPNGPDVSYTNLPLSGRVLWPGAVPGPDGRGIDWPGWTELPDGTWVEGDEFDWVRPSVTVELEINPVTTAVVGYPPSSPQCATNPPPNPPRVPPPPGVPPTPGVPPGPPSPPSPPTPAPPGGGLPPTR